MPQPKRYGGAEAHPVQLFEVVRALAGACGSTGCDHAGWALLGALGPGKSPDFVTVLVPRADYRVVDVWDIVGLRGTGSNDILVEDAAVPAHRVLRNAELARLTGSGQRVNTGPSTGARSARSSPARSRR